MENCSKSIQSVIDPVFYEVIILKDGACISLRLTRYELDNLNLFTFVHLGCTITIKSTVPCTEL